LGKRGLYYEVGAQKNRDLSIDALLWLLNYCDGTHSLLDIATKSGIKLSIMRDGVHLLLKNGLLKQID
jgi:aminopeptidase-like protein